MQAENTFNLTRARANIGVDSVAPPGPTTESSTLSRSNAPGTLPTSTLLSSSSSQPGPSTSNQNNIGAIIGGVIGGVAVAIMLVGLSVYLLRRRSKRSTAPTFVSHLNTGTTLQAQVPMHYEDSNSGGKHGAEPQVYVRELHTDSRSHQLTRGRLVLAPTGQCAHWERSDAVCDTGCPT